VFVRKNIVSSIYVEYFVFRFPSEQDKNLSNVLLIGSASEIPAGEVGLIKEIPFLNGEIALRIVKR